MITKHRPIIQKTMLAATADFITSTLPATSIFALALLLPGIATAATSVVNVQYYSMGGGGGQSGNASMSGLQGIVASTDSTPYWNQYTASGYGQIASTDAVLYEADDSGGFVDSLARLTTEITQSSVQNTSTTPLFRGGLYTAPGDPDSTPTITITLSGLTSGQLYDLYVYAAGTIYNTNTRITVTGRTVNSASTVWNSSTTTFTASNTASFIGMLPDANGKLTIVADAVSGAYRGINGLSLVTTVPEPSTYALFGMGALALFARRRKVAKSFTNRSQNLESPCIRSLSQKANS